MPPINLYELGFDKVYIKIINSSNYISIRLVFFVQLSDTVMVGQIGSRDLAAISFGGNVHFFFIYIFGIGIVSVGVIHDGVSTTIHREVLQSATLWVVSVEVYNPQRFVCPLLWKSHRTSIYTLTFIYEFQKAF